MDYSIDQNSDYASRELYSFLSGVNIPDFVKQASLDSVRVTEKVAFADPIGRRFPINSKSNVYISNAFLINKKAGIQKLKGELYVNRVEAAINKAAEALDITKDLEAYNKVAIEKMAEAPEDLSVKLKLAGDEVTLFNVKTATQLLDGVNNFVRDLNKFPYSWRRGISTQFVKAAEALDVKELPDIVVKYAGQYFPDIIQVKEEVLRRSTKLAGEDKENYIKIANDLSNVSAREEIFKLAEYCYETEKKAGLYENKYAKKVLPDPVDSFFTLHSEKVANLLDTVTMGGERFAMDDLKKVSSDIYEKAFGFELDIKSAEAKDVLPTMPKSDVSLFKQLSGVKPV